ncbi:MAG: pentapeptide repeat-containing protein [Spirochaetes bacterium]|nr:pentapeptide repeat-containing protein [Spirochaetota bacterium]
MLIENEFNGIPFPDDETEFNNCRFENCTFTDSDVSGVEFNNCIFKNCNCSMMTVNDTVFNDVVFEGCKMTGINFSNVNKFFFTVSFNGCNLDFSIFEKSNLKKMEFTECSIVEASFIESNLQSACFAGCNLKGTLFERSNLEKCNFASASNYFIDCEKNRVKGAVFSLPEVINLLMKYEIKIV